VSKERNRGNREAKKPKAKKKIVAPAATFLRPSPVPAVPPAKDTKK
jgi:hypothetical protein